MNIIKNKKLIVGFVIGVVICLAIVLVFTMCGKDEILLGFDWGDSRDVVKAELTKNKRLAINRDTDEIMSAISSFEGVEFSKEHMLSYKFENDSLASASLLITDSEEADKIYGIIRKKYERVSITDDSFGLGIETEAYKTKNYTLSIISMEGDGIIEEGIWFNILPNE